MLGIDRNQLFQRLKEPLGDPLRRMVVHTAMDDSVTGRAQIIDVTVLVEPGQGRLQRRIVIGEYSGAILKHRSLAVRYLEAASSMPNPVDQDRAPKLIHCSHLIEGGLETRRAGIDREN